MFGILRKGAALRPKEICLLKKKLQGSLAVFLTLWSLVSIYSLLLGITAHLRLHSILPYPDYNVHLTQRQPASTSVEQLTAGFKGEMNQQISYFLYSSKTKRNGIGDGAAGLED